MAKIALVTDTHFGFKNDSREFLDYFAKFYDGVFFPTLRERGVTQVAHLGDIVDRRKYIGYVTLRRFHEMFLDRMRELDVWYLVGNHDVPYRNTNEVNALSELLRAREDHGRIVSEPMTVDFDGCEVMLMPWINSGNYASCMSAMRDTRAQVLFGHLEIKGFEMYRGQPSHEGFDRSVFDKFDVVCSGHFHRKSTDRNINYLGAPYELTWADYEDVKGFHIFDTATRELEFVRNPYSIYKKVWYDDDGKSMDEATRVDASAVSGSHVKIITVCKSNPYWFEKFVDAVNSAGPLSAQIVEDHKNMDSDFDDEDVERAEDTMSVIDGYVRNLPVSASVKTELDSLMRKLYNEASNMESVE